MIACLDVHYEFSTARGACVLAESWSSLEPSVEIVQSFDDVAPYVSGQFYRRELPCLLALLDTVAGRHDGLSAVVVDGFVWLGGRSKPGLGGHLFKALGRGVAVVGVAKSRMPKASPSAEVLRGSSDRPLYVSAAGMEIDTACRLVESMHGEFRIPTLLKRVDQLSRGRL